MTYSCSDMADDMYDAFISAGWMKDKPGSVEPSQQADMIFAAMERMKLALVEARDALKEEYGDGYGETTVGKAIEAAFNPPDEVEEEDEEEAEGDEA